MSDVRKAIEAHFRRLRDQGLRPDLCPSCGSDKHEILPSCLEIPGPAIFDMIRPSAGSMPVVVLICGRCFQTRLFSWRLLVEHAGLEKIDT